MNQSIFQKIQIDNDEKIESMNIHYKSNDIPTDPKILHLLNISEDDAKDVRCFDSVGNLRLYHSINNRNERVMHIRGIVIDIEQLRVVCKAFPFTPDIWFSHISNTILSDVNVISKAKIKPLHEGTILRTIRHEGKWGLSTHRKIDGTKSMWNSKPFGDLFRETIGITDNNLTIAEILDSFNLNENYCYVFLLSHPQNSLVKNNKVATLYHITSFDVEKGMLPIETKIDHKGIEYIQDLPVKNLEELQQAIQERGGVLMFLENGIAAKVVSDDYFLKRQLIGNEPNIKVRYIQLLKLGLKHDEIVNYMPDRTKQYNALSRNFTYLCNKLFNEFCTRYVYKKFLKTNQKRHIFIEHMLSDFPNPNVNDKPNIRKAIEVKLLDEPPYRIINMIDELLTE